MASNQNFSNIEKVEYKSYLKVEKCLKPSISTNSKYKLITYGVK